MIFPPSLQGVPNAKNSYLYSRLMFLQSNAEHQKKERKGEEEGRGTVSFSVPFTGWFFTAVALHDVKDCKQANNNS